MKVELTNEQLITKAHQLIKELCESGGRSWTLRIPADPEKDPDIIFSELCSRLRHSSPVTEGREVTRANAAQVLAGFLFNDKNKFPLSAVKGSIQKGFDIDLQDQLSFLMNFQSWLFDNYLRRTTQQGGYSMEDMKKAVDFGYRQNDKNGHISIPELKQFLSTLPSTVKQNDKK